LLMPTLILQATHSPIIAGETQITSLRAPDPSDPAIAPLHRRSLSSMLPTVAASAARLALNGFAWGGFAWGGLVCPFPEDTLEFPGDCVPDLTA
jgi:hypothetical protein